MVFNRLEDVKSTSVQMYDVVKLFVRKDAEDDDIYGLIKYGPFEKSKGGPYHNHLASVARACVMFVRHSRVR